MGYDRIATLSPQQLACLRKVVEHKDSAVIGYELGIAKNTVDVHIAKALTKLGVSTRREAAAMLMKHDRSTSDSTTTDFVGVDPTAPFADYSIRPKRTGSTLRDAAAGYNENVIPSATPDPAKPDETKRNNLNNLQTIGLSIVIVMGLFATIILATAASNSIQDIANFFRSPSQH